MPSPSPGAREPATAAGFPDLWAFVGVGLLIACAIYISWRERVRHVEPIRDFEQP